MLKPITTEERAKYTLKVQMERGTQDLLAEVYESGYNGYLDVWPELGSNKRELIFEIKSKRVLLATSTPSNENSVRYHVLQGKGCKRIK